MLSNSKSRAFASLAVLCIVVVIAGALFLRKKKALSPVAPPDAHPHLLLFSQLPSSAPVLAYADVAALRRLQNTPLGSVLGLAAPGPAEDREYRQFVQQTGFDYTRDLDKVAVAFWPANLSPSEAVTPNRIVAIADGHFERKKIDAYTLLTGKILKLGGRELHEFPGDPPVAFEFLSSTRIRIASGARPVEILSSDDPPWEPGALQSRIGDAADVPIFAIARTDQLPRGFYSAFQKSPQLEQLARSVKEITLAAKPSGRDITAVLDARCDSLKNALELSALLSGFRIAGRAELADPSVRRQMTAQQIEFLDGLLNHASTSRDGDHVHLTFEITPDMLGSSR